MFQKIKIQPKYLLRLDDASEKMNTQNWNRIFKIIDNYNIKSLIAIVPKNQDPEISFENISNVEEIYKKWINSGHDLAIHGYDHVYNSKGVNYIKNKNKSEFAGKDYLVQKSIISKSINYFREFGIEPNFFVAPGHSFDEVTIKVISENFNKLIISDGLTLSPFIYKNVRFIPQQINRLIRIPLGTITYCLHPNNMNDSEFLKLDRFLKANQSFFISFKNLTFTKITMIQRFTQFILNTAYKLKN